MQPSELLRLQGVTQAEGSVTALSLPERARNQAVREQLAAAHYDAKAIVAENKDILDIMYEMPFRVVGQKLVKGEPLSFEEAFVGMTFAVAATNRAMFHELQPRIQEAHQDPVLDQRELLGPGQTFLTSMAQREAHGTLTAVEIAGMAAAAMMDINLRIGVNGHTHGEGILETSGMGGDKGFVVNGQKRKVINASTLSAVVLSSLDIPVIKHGSYSNTSKVGSTEAIEAMGVNIYQGSYSEIVDMLLSANFYFSDAHIAKTIHDLSHSPYMRHETINHIIGPMTPPIGKDVVLNKIIGVNEGVHPALIAKAYAILHQIRDQTVGNVIAVSGLSEDYQSSSDVSIHDQMGMRPYMMLDEVSPYKTLLGVVQNGEYKGTFLIDALDFGVYLDPDQILIENAERDLLAANREALHGLNNGGSDYLALNAAIGLFAAEYLGLDDAIVDGTLNTSYLRECFLRCKEAILSGKAGQHLEKIITASNGKEVVEQEDIFSNVDLVIFDVDGTLILPRDTAFYKEFSFAVNRAVSRYFDVSAEQGEIIANYYRVNFGGGERALFDGTAHEHFPHLPVLDPNYAVVYEEMVQIDPTGEFDHHGEIVALLSDLRARGKKIVGLTDAPEGLSRRMLLEAGIDPDEMFDAYFAYQPESGPNKHIRKEKIFAEIADKFDIDPVRVLSVGDTYYNDIEPAVKLGMQTCLVSANQRGDYSGNQIGSLQELLGRNIV